MKKILLILLSFLLSLNCYGEVDFNGDADFISLGTMGTVGGNIDTQGLIFSCWLKSSTTNAVMCILGTVNEGSDTFIQVNLNANGAEALNAGYIHVGLRDEYNRIRDGAVESNTGITDGEWHHLVVEYHGGVSHRVYLDGVLQTFNQDGTQVLDNTGNFEYAVYIGARNLRGVADRMYTGAITEVAFWQNAAGGTMSLGDAEQLALSKIKRMPLQTIPSLLQSYHPLDEYPSGSGISGKTYNDMSGNGNTGTGVDANANSTNVGEEVLSYPK